LAAISKTSPFVCYLYYYHQQNSSVGSERPGDLRGNSCKLLNKI